MYKLTIEFTEAGQKYFNDSPRMEIFSEFEDDLQNTLKAFHALDLRNQLNGSDEKLILSFDIEKMAIRFTPIIPRPLPELEKLPKRIHARNKKR